jgi:hypothetical protein
MYSRPGKPFIISFGREPAGIICEFIIAAATEAGSSHSSNIETRWEMQTRQSSVQREKNTTESGGDGAVGWGVERGMSPARTMRTRDEEEEDLYGEPMHLDDEEEVPPTQQERYQGIFDN